MNKLLPIACCLLAANVNAKNNDDIIFQCTTTNNKAIRVTGDNKNIEYSFGKTNYPELVLTKPRSEVTSWQWQGMGRNENYTINIMNDHSEYRIFDNIDHTSQKHTYGIEVTVNPNSKPAIILCDNKQPIISKIQNIDLTLEN